MSRSIVRAPRGFRPPASSRAYTRPYARAADASNGSASKCVSTRCKRSWRCARSFESRAACGPAASSARLMVVTYASSGNADASTLSMSMKTQVSRIPYRTVFTKSSDLDRGSHRCRKRIAWRQWREHVRTREGGLLAKSIDAVVRGSSPQPARHFASR